MDREVLWSEDFDRQFKKLARKRRRIFDDLSELLADFEAGLLPGKVAQGVHGLPVKVARMSDRTSNRGKSSGFRVAYYYNDDIILLTFITQRDQLDRRSTSRIMDTLRSAGLSP
jgi:mRNA-degrading endonuclease RelE of RelBE toxin-antitoxin system